MRWAHGTVIGLTINLVQACGPQYVIEEDFVGPTSTDGIACVSSCQEVKNECESSCRNRFVVCKDKYLIEAEQSMPLEMQIYEITMTNYQRDRDRYDQNLVHFNELTIGLKSKKKSLTRSCNSGDRSACVSVIDVDASLQDITDQYYRENGPLVKEPIKPVAPDLQKKVKQLTNAHCDFTCWCNSNFDSCFAQCGGKVVKRRICVDRCD